MKVSKVLETSLYVNDLDAAEAWYTRVLGLETYAKLEGRHVFFRLPDGMLLLFNPESTKSNTMELGSHGAHGDGHVAFEMAEDEIQPWRDHLAAVGVPIELEHTWPNGGFSIYFRDPDGNSLEVVTRKTWGL